MPIKVTWGVRKAAKTACPCALTGDMERVRDPYTGVWTWRESDMVTIGRVKVTQELRGWTDADK